MKKIMIIFLTACFLACSTVTAYGEVFIFEAVYVGEQKSSVQEVKAEDSPKLHLSKQKKAKAPDDFPYDLETFAAEVLRLTNEARAEAGAPPLEIDPTLGQMAQARMKENDGKLSHTRPDGSTPDTIFAEYDTDLVCTGEIIMSTSRSPQNIVDGFLSSPSHRKNMLNPNHRYVGIGVAWGDTPAGKGIAVLELFAK